MQVSIAKNFISITIIIRACHHSKCLTNWSDYCTEGVEVIELLNFSWKSDHHLWQQTAKLGRWYIAVKSLQVQQWLIEHITHQVSTHNTHMLYTDPTHCVLSRRWVWRLTSQHLNTLRFLCVWHYVWTQFKCSSPCRDAITQGCQCIKVFIREARVHETS